MDRIDRPPTTELISQAAAEKLDAYIASLRDNNNRPQTHFHPSTIGACPRKTVMERLKLCKPQHDERVQRIFENGHSTHERIQKELKEAGILVLDEVPVEAPEYNMKGHTDGIGKLYLPSLGGVSVILEIKTISQNGWDWMMGGGPKHRQAHGPKRDNLWQVQLYLFMTGLPYALIIYECKNDQRRAYFTIKRDNELIQNVLLPRVQLVNAHVESKTLPPRDLEHQIVKSKVPFDCQYCDYRALCEEEERLTAGGLVVDLLALSEQLYPAPEDTR